ncbi:MAG: hypothetical protein AAF804_20585 [Bacteroidota bacterium]
MSDLFQAMLAPSVVIYTILIGVAALYWITVFIGLLDLDFLDFDLDADFEADLDLEVDADVDTDLEGTGSAWWTQAFAFFNLGKVPFMVFFSFLALFMWTGALLAYDLLGSALPWLGWIVLLPNLVVALFATKIVSFPVAKLFHLVKHENSSQKDLVGKIATLTMAAHPGSLSQAEITFDHNHFLINVESSDEEILSRGSKVLLVEYRAESDRFLITSFQV